MIKVLLFAGIQEKLKIDHLSIPINDVNVSDLKEYLVQTYPDFENEWRQSMIAINQEFACEDQIIKDTDEVAIIPPVSGG